MKLGMVTYNMGKDMPLRELLDFCEETGMEGVELRTTHAHGVEATLDGEERADVKKMFADSSVELVGLGSAFEYHSNDEGILKDNIDNSKTYADLAADVGAPGIKVRPNGIQTDKGIPVEKTCEQIGRALREVAEYAAGVGVEVRLEVHGRGSSDPKFCRMMMESADHANARICWNSNQTDLDENGSIDAAWDLLKDYIALVHINEIGVYQYPWQDLFDKLAASGYAGYCLAEVQYNEQPERFMKYYRTLFDLYTGNYRWPRD